MSSLFPPRPGTAAWDMKPVVPERITGVPDTEEIRRISQSESYKRYLEATEGQTVLTVLLEEEKSRSGGVLYWEGNF